jgi:archaellum component FlaF (FlaF/FlaG flagellin family)
LFVQAWKVYLTNSSVVNSNSSNANSQGVVSLTTSGSAVVVLGDVLFEGILLTLAADGALSLRGEARSLSVEGVTFRNIRTGGAGGAVHLNVSKFEATYSVDTYISNSV